MEAGYLCKIFLLLHLVVAVTVKATDEKDNTASWKKKDVRDYTDADLERLFEQWEDADEPLEEDELPEWKRPQPQIDLSQLNANDPEGMLKMSKKGRTLMMFATVSGNPAEKETETLTQLWQSSLFNANFETQRYVVGSNRVLFMLKDGSKAWEVKDFLVSQERCELVTIEGKDYYGRGSPNYEGTPADKTSQSTKQKEASKKSKSKSKKTDNSTKDKKKKKKDEL